MRHLITTSATLSLLAIASILSAQQAPTYQPNQQVQTLPPNCQTQQQMQPPCAIPCPPVGQSANPCRKYAVPPGAKNSFEAFLGSAYSFHTGLDITQTGQPDLDFTAHYSTKPFTSPFYYDVRYGRWNGDSAWEIELLHHKVYLDNNPPEVQHFEITHGYNHLMINRAYFRNGFIWHFGLGAVIAHTENTVRGLSVDSNYEFTGPCGQVAVGKRWYFSQQFFGTLEGKVTAAYAHVSVANGHANAPNVAIHGLFGIGYAF